MYRESILCTVRCKVNFSFLKVSLGQFEECLIPFVTSLLKYRVTRARLGATAEGPYVT